MTDHYQTERDRADRAEAEVERLRDVVVVAEEMVKNSIYVGSTDELMVPIEEWQQFERALNAYQEVKGT